MVVGGLSFRGWICYHNWVDYEEGFSNLTREFCQAWVKYIVLHQIEQTLCEWILETLKTNTAYAQYSTFSIGDNTTEYTLSVGGYSGTAGDGLSDAIYGVAYNHSGVWSFLRKTISMIMEMVHGLITVYNLISMHLIIPMEDLLKSGVEYCGMTRKVAATPSSLQRWKFNWINTAS